MIADGSSFLFVNSREESLCCTLSSLILDALEESKLIEQERSAMSNAVVVNCQQKLQY